MYAFADRKGRPICLVPEVTGMIQEIWNASWSKQRSKPYRIFYVARCYRYERPQYARYREFTQLGIEMLGGTAPQDRCEVESLLRQILDATDVTYELDPNVKRGLGYYVEDGFEARCPWLGAQKQIAGGGRYTEGVGWAIGVDRLAIAIAELERRRGARSLAPTGAGGAGGGRGDDPGAIGRGDSHGNRDDERRGRGDDDDGDGDGRAI